MSAAQLTIIECQVQQFQGPLCGRVPQPGGEAGVSSTRHHTATLAPQPWPQVQNDPTLLAALQEYTVFESGMNIKAINITISSGHGIFF